MERGIATEMAKIAGKGVASKPAGLPGRDKAVLVMTLAGGRSAAPLPTTLPVPGVRPVTSTAER